MSGGMLRLELSFINVAPIFPFSSFGEKFFLKENRWMSVFDPSAFHSKYPQHLPNNVCFRTENIIQSDYSILALF